MAEIGRPTVMTPEILNKLEEVFALGGTDKEACFYAGISHQALYNYQHDHPEFIERKEALKERPILKARQTIVRGLDEAENAKWYLERKAKKEFANRQELDLSGKLEVTYDTETKNKVEGNLDSLLGLNN